MWIWISAIVRIVGCFGLAFMQWWLLTHRQRFERHEGRFWAFVATCRRAFLMFWLAMGTLAVLQHLLPLLHRAGT